MNIEISVIIPTYKRPQKIVETIELLQHQTFKDYEIIVVDDNGIHTEDQIFTQKKISELNIPNLKYYCLDKNHGAPYARNFGALKSSGKYLAFLDDDDFWIPTKLEYQFLYSTQKANLSFCFCKQVLVNKGKEKTFSNWFYHGDTLKKLTQGNFVGSSSNPLILKKAFMDVKGFDLNLPSCQDWDLWYRLSKLAYPIYLDKVLVKIDRIPSIRISSNKFKVLLGHLMLFEKIKIEHNNKITSLLIFKLKILKHILSYII